MKKILLLTDFSKRNKSAEKTALNLCNQLCLDLLIMNNYFAIPLIPFSTGRPSTAASSSLYDEAQDEILAQVKAIREEISKMPAATYYAKVRSVITEGDIGLKVAEIIPREDIELVVMGAGKGNSFEHLLLGNVVQSVIDNSSCPVLVIPEMLQQQKVKKIVFATDFNSQDFNAFDYLTRLSKLLGFSIEVVHVYNPSTASNEESKLEVTFIKKLKDFSDLNIHYTHLVGEKIIEEINQLCKSGNDNWLVMTDHPRSLLMGFRHKSTILKMLEKQRLPILIFPKLMLPARYFLKPLVLKKDL